MQDKSVCSWLREKPVSIKLSELQRISTRYNGASKCISHAKFFTTTLPTR